jgi:hypothetical protein
MSIEREQKPADPGLRGPNLLSSVQMRIPCHLIAEPYTFKISCSDAGIRNGPKVKGDH